MTWIGVKRWIGTHPVWAISAGTFCCLLVSDVAYVMYHIIDFDLGWRIPVVRSPYPAAALVLALTSGAVACAVGRLRARAGLATLGLMSALIWTPLVCVAAAACCSGVAVMLSGFPSEPRKYLGWFAVVIPAAWFIVTFAQVFGLIAAAWITRWKITRGKWEVTMPVERPEIKG